MITSEQFFYLNATIITINGVFVGMPSYRQYKLAQQKLKLDLFDRRFKHWDALKSLYAAMHNGPNAEAVISFIGVTWRSDFLFGKDVADHLEKLGKVSLNAVRLLGEKHNLARDGQIEKAATVKKQYDLVMGEFETLYADSIKKFEPYLSFSKLKH